MRVCISAGKSDRNRTERRNKKREGKGKRWAQAESRRVFVMDEKKAERETQTEKEEYLCSPS